MVVPVLVVERSLGVGILSYGVMKGRELFPERAIGGLQESAMRIGDRRRLDARVLGTGRGGKGAKEGRGASGDDHCPTSVEVLGNSKVQHMSSCGNRIPGSLMIRQSGSDGP